jgi:RNA-directed DNA polymerase
MNTANASLNTKKEWNTINWTKIQRKVFKLQTRIFQAVKSGQKAKARKLQKLLLKSHYAKLLAVRQVTQDHQEKNTASVDGIKSLTQPQRLKLVQELDSYGYKTQPLKKIWISKLGLSPQTPLMKKATRGEIGIATIKDRAMQTLVKSVLEPYWEALFEGTSYGFRPGKSTHDAIDRIFHLTRQQQKYVCVGGIAKCFDEINDDYLLSKLECPTKVRKMVKKWLKSGVMDRGIFEETISGTSQGGLISPLLGNITLDGMIRDISGAFPKSIQRNGKQFHDYQPRIIRYAHDFVVLHSELDVILKCKEMISIWLKRANLQLNPEKMRICHTNQDITIKGATVKAGLDFLGFNIRQFPVNSQNRVKNSKIPGFKLLITPSQTSIKAHYECLKKIVDKYKHAPQETLIKNLNPVISGWCNDYNTVISKDTFKKLDHLLWNKLRAWVDSRTGFAGGKQLRKYFSQGINGSWTFECHGIYLRKHAFNFRFHENRVYMMD